MDINATAPPLRHSPSQSSQKHLQKKATEYVLPHPLPLFFYCISPADESKAEIYIFLNQSNQLINSSHKILKFHI